MFKLTLQQLLAAIALWSVCLAVVFGEIFDRSYVYLFLVAAVTIPLFFWQVKNPFQAAFLAWPVACLLNFTALLTCLGAYMGGNNQFEILVAPIANAVCFPSVMLRECIPLAGVADDLIAFFVVSLVEVGLMALVITAISSKVGHGRN